MPGPILDAGATITCPHGGQVQVVPRAVRVSLGGNPPLLVDDVSTVAGCAFNVSGAPSPCLRVQWTMPATRVKAQGSPVLLSSSIGLCVNAGGAPQGPATLLGYQTKVLAR
ncbi:MAG: hypothetical protein ACR2KK_02735 [Acidimicrobiales bacterium]